MSLKKQLVGYTISGICATGTDYIIYNALIYAGLSYYSVAKTISFLCGTLVAFFYNKYITFQAPEKSYREVALFFVLYVISMVCNVSINSFGLELFHHFLSFQYSLTAAFLLATFASMAINFIGQKCWVFAKKANA